MHGLVTEARLTPPVIATLYVHSLATERDGYMEAIPVIKTNLRDIEVTAALKDAIEEYLNATKHDGWPFRAWRPDIGCDYLFPSPVTGGHIARQVVKRLIKSE